VTRAFVVGRTRHGRPIEPTVRVVRDSLRAAGWKVDSRVVRRKRAMTRRAASAVAGGCDVVVVVGGDGAVLRVAGALADTKATLGIIPAGTGNLLAGNLGIPKHRGRATRTILGGETRRIDLGRVTVEGARRDFAVACGVGFDARVVRATGGREKLRWGRLAYFAHVLRQSTSIHNVEHELVLDGVPTTTEAAQVFIANFGRMLPWMAPQLPVEPDDGKLDVVVVRADGPVSAFLAGWEALRQTEVGETDAGHVFRARAREVTIKTTPARLVEADGSVVGTTPVTITVLPGALTVLVPAA
jgi:diacylglycerol kinase (ATP)